MPFTLCSHGQVLGETDFELRASGSKRAGAFRPTQAGATLLPTLTGIGPALLALGARYEREGLTTKDTDAAMAMFAESDVMSFAKQLDALRLELRDTRGKVIPTQSLAVHDVEKTLGPEAIAKHPDQPRYIISATLAARRRRLFMRAVEE